MIAGRAARVRARDACSVTGAAAICSTASPPARRSPSGCSHGDRVEALPAGLRRSSARARTARRRRWRRRRASSGACSSTPRWRTRRAAARSSRTSCFASAAASRAGRWPASSSEAVARDQRPRSATHGRAICGLSGGVDSSVAAALVLKAIGDSAHLHLRRQRACCARTRRRRSSRCSATRSRPTCASSTPSERFLGKLAGVTDPEQKRKIIGREFIAVFEEEAEEDRRRRVPRAGHAVPRRHRVGVVQGAVGDDQDAPQRGRAARADAPQADRAAARAVQGRGARAGRRARPAAPRAVAAAVPRARGWRCACSAR